MLIRNQERIDKIALYLKDFDDAASVAKLLVENGYTVLVGPADFTTQGVKVVVYDVLREQDQPMQRAGGPLDG